MVEKKDYRIVEYDPEKQRVWDEFVRDESVNGTIFHTRNFLSYHPDERFIDQSIIVYHHERPVCVFPACDDEGVAFSHCGSSYGGPILAAEYYRIKKMVPILETIYEYYRGNLAMRIAPSIFGTPRNDPIVYFFSRVMNITCELGVCKNLEVEDLIESMPRQSHRSAIRRNIDNDALVRTPNSRDEIETFYQILKSNLQNHNEEPTHTFKELLGLRKRLGDDQVLLLSFDVKGEMDGGTWVFKASDQTWHTFYIAKDYSKGDYATTPFVLYHAMRRAREEGAAFLNFGICTTEKGKKINEGLFDFKESLGGETINRYILE